MCEQTSGATRTSLAEAMTRRRILVAAAAAVGVAVLAWFVHVWIAVGAGALAIVYGMGFLMGAATETGAMMRRPTVAQLEYELAQARRQLAERQQRRPALASVEHREYRVLPGVQVDERQG